MVDKQGRSLTLTIDIPLPEGDPTYEQLVAAFTKKAEDISKMLLEMAKELSNGQDGT